MSGNTDRVSNGEQIRWQRQAAALLGTLLELAARESLPAIAWTVQSAGASLVGQVLSHTAARRREDFTAWKAAITAASCSAPDHDHKLAPGDTSGEARLTASWKHLPILVRAAGRERVQSRARGPGGQHLAR